ncbi:hypothetical protein ONZ45_g10429 [Pleurotus djamor]|nr:hypothetical protein ONZ45_g10429 [Pleurotus djamor]
MPNYPPLGIWKYLRDTEGWAALQHHAVLRGTLTITPPTSGSSANAEAQKLRLLVQLLQASFFAIVPANRATVSGTQIKEAHWHHGNIYSMERALPQAVNLPTPPSSTEPTTYDIFISGEYEIRLFGDPKSYGSDFPIQSLQISVEAIQATDEITHEPSQDVICDFVEGHSFGNALGIGLRSLDGWWIVKHATLQSSSLLQASITRDNIPISLEVENLREGLSKTVKVILKVTQRPLWEGADLDPHYAIKTSYFYAGSMPTNFLVVPPLKPNATDVPKAPILCLLKGLDWHGPSAQDAWNSLDALITIVKSNQGWNPWKLLDNSPAVVLGHSNGGQGAWYIASRYPDRVLAVAPMAAYIKSQSYVPWTQSRSGHYLDPALRAILQTALTADDNDLFMTNIAHVPVLAIHGGRDDNVPVWHSREYVSVLKTLNPDANAIFREDPGQPHWYDLAVTHPDTIAFLKAGVESSLSASPQEFTLTVANPSESGSLFGFKVLRLSIPGRLGKLKVNKDERGLLNISTTNVDAFQVDFKRLRLDSVPIDFSIDATSFQEVSSCDCMFRKWNASWNILTGDKTPLLHCPGRAQRILSSAAPITLIIPEREQTHELSIALRIAHNLHTYHRLDSTIVSSNDALRLLEEGSIHGNIIYLGMPFTPFARSILECSPAPFDVVDDQLLLKGQLIPHPEEGVLCLHPHPRQPSALVLMVIGEGTGLERAFRQIPLRTGVPTPDWLVMSNSSDTIAEGGILGAGFVSINLPTSSLHSEDLFPEYGNVIGHGMK